MKSAGVKLTRRPYEEWKRSRKPVWTDAEVAKLLGISPSTINHWGKTTVPDKKCAGPLSKITDGRVTPNDWYANLAKPTRFIELTDEEWHGVSHGEEIPWHDGEDRRKTIICRQNRVKVKAQMAEAAQQGGRAITFAGYRR
jgi:DNA-binding transcriptional regulator YdaS (Cro superfamily)